MADGRRGPVCSCRTHEHAHTGNPAGPSVRAAMRAGHVLGVFEIEPAEVVRARLAAALCSRPAVMGAGAGQDIAGGQPIAVEESSRGPAGIIIAMSGRAEQVARASGQGESGRFGAELQIGRLIAAALKFHADRIGRDQMNGRLEVRQVA
jgi:hypothetical protein